MQTNFLKRYRLFQCNEVRNWAETQSRNSSEKTSVVSSHVIISRDAIVQPINATSWPQELA